MLWCTTTSARPEGRSEDAFDDYPLHQALWVHGGWAFLDLDKDDLWKFEVRSTVHSEVLKAIRIRASHTRNRATDQLTHQITPVSVSDQPDPWLSRSRGGRGSDQGEARIRSTRGTKEVRQEAISEHRHGDAVDWGVGFRVQD